MVMSEDFFLLTHRKEIAVEAIKQGFDVALAAKETGCRTEIEALGVRLINMPVNPTGMNLRQELKTLRFLRKLYRSEQPDIIHHVGLKSVLWGTLALKTGRKLNIPAINAISGLGITFSGDKPSATARLILRTLRFASGENTRYIFQNHQDEDLFMQHKVTTPQYSTFIKGSGVDLQLFAHTPIPETQPVKVLFAARMVKEKGVDTLIEAAEMLRSEYAGRVEFLLCGKLSQSPKAIRREWLEEHCDGGYIQWLGHRSDMRELLAGCHMVAFPSYYREGVPKSLLEACAAGRPIITCDSVGCRDVVDEGVNGFLIPPKAGRELADRLKILIDNPALRQRMGDNSRRKAETEFAIGDVVKRHMDLYKEAAQRQQKA